MKLVTAALFSSFLALGAAASAAPKPLPTNAPVRDILETLDLSAVALHDGPAVVRLELTTEPSTAPFEARGRRILQTELVNAAALRLKSVLLQYDEDGRLIEICPDLPADADPADGEKLMPRCFDLSPFLLDVPRLGEPDAVERWRAFAPVWARDQALIARLLDEKFGRFKGTVPELWKKVFPYRLHSLNAKTGRWSADGFDPGAFGEKPDVYSSSVPPEELIRKYADPESRDRRAVMPMFPTVYALAIATPDELEYLRRVRRDFDLKTDSRILVIGPGTGVDTWIASKRTTRPVKVIGINPLEVANTRCTARLAGFPAEVIVGDNAVDEAGRPRFPGETFDAVLWDMPAYFPKPIDDGRTPLMTAWDGDVGGVVMKRLARALPGLLAPGGFSLLWNVGPKTDGPDPVEDMIKAEGLTVEIQRFRRGRKTPPEYFTGRLYTVRRPAGR